MLRKNPNKKYVNKLLNMKVVGQGSKGDYFGKIDNIISFISNSEGKFIQFGDVVDVKVIHATEKCLFCDVMDDES